MTGRRLSPEESRQVAIVDYMVSVGEKVEAHGYTVQGIIPDDPADGFVMYTVGLWPAHPELMVRGLDGGVGHAILERMAEQVVARQLLRCCGVEPDEDSAFRPGRHAGVLDGFEVEVLPRDDGDWSVANRWHMGAPYERLLVAWPDEEGRLPSDPSFDERYRAQQGL